MNRINYGGIGALTASDLDRALKRDGFDLVRQRGSHHRYVHSDGRRVTVAFTRRGDTFEIKTLRSIIEIQAKWTEEDLKRLGML